MKKANLVLATVFILILLSLNVTAWTNCTTPSCPAGYTDNGEYCIAGLCYRNCTGLTCDGSWTQVHSDSMIFQSDDAWEYDQSSSYTTSNISACYQFKVDALGEDFKLDMDNDYFDDCDGEGIAGFWESGKPSHPWYENLTDTGEWGSRYWGDVSYSSYDYFYIALRSHTETDSNNDGNYDPRMEKDYSIYCAPTAEGCNNLSNGNYSINCDIGCYNSATYAYMAQGVEEDTQGSTSWDGANDNLRSSDECSDSYVTQNFFRYPYYRVYIMPTSQINTDQSCERTNEAPTVSNVKVAPENPTAGDDLFCNYTYSDPESFEEKDSAYEWWKNGANQNINSKILSRGNLSVNDEWYCKVTPSDGLLNGTQQSSNNVTILNTAQNPKMYVGNDMAWDSAGYFSDAEIVLDFKQELEDALQSCTPDAEGFCNITLSVSSDSNSKVNLSELKIHYKEKFLFNITLVNGWNLISIPVTLENNSISSIMGNCSYTRVWKWNPHSTWQSTDSGLKTVDINHGYWIDRIGLNDSCTISVTGEIPSSTQIDIVEGWNLVGSPSLTSNAINGLISPTLYTRIWEYNQVWTSTDSGLTTMKPGKGYWIDSKNSSSYTVIN